MKIVTVLFLSILSSTFAFANPESARYWVTLAFNGNEIELPRLSQFHVA